MLFGHVECKNVDDSVSACQSFEVAGVRVAGVRDRVRSKKTWDECVR